MAYVGTGASHWWPHHARFSREWGVARPAQQSSTTPKASCTFLVIRHLIEVETSVASANHVEPSLLGCGHAN